MCHFLGPSLVYISLYLYVKPSNLSARNIYQSSCVSIDYMIAQFDISKINLLLQKYKVIAKHFG